MDRLSDLSDNILCRHILSKLPLKTAIRCSILRRRWKDLWTKLPHLNFSCEFFATRKKKEDQLNQIQTLITTIFHSHSAPLESLCLELQSLPVYNSNRISFQRYNFDCCKRENIWQWIHLAGLKRVKEITLSEGPDCYCGLHPFELPSSLFSCNLLTFLSLKNFAFTNIPNCFGGFSCLETCSLSNMTLKDEIFDQLLAGCPHLKKLTISCCTGLSKLRISAPNLNNFNFEFTEILPSMSLNCPQLIEIRLGKIPIVCDSDFPKDQKKKFPLPLELNLPSCQHLCVECKLLEPSNFSNMKQVRKLTLLDIIPGKGQPFITIISRFLDIEELCMDSDCFQDTATGEVARTLSLPLEKLKNVVINVSGFGEKEIAMIGCLLRSASLLQTMTLFLPECLKGIHDRNFANRVLDLKRSSADVSLVIKEKSRMFFPCRGCPHSRYIAIELKIAE